MLPGDVAHDDMVEALASDRTDDAFRERCSSSSRTTVDESDGVRFSTRQSAKGESDSAVLLSSWISVQPRRQTAACVECREITLSIAHGIRDASSR